MSIISNEYFTDIDEKDIANSNLINCIDSDGNPAFLIRSNSHHSVVNKFSSDNLELKTNWPMSFNDLYIGAFHIFSCRNKTDTIRTSFSRAISFLFRSSDKPMSSDDITMLFQTFITIFKVTPEKDNFLLQIGLYGEIVVLNFLIDNGYHNIA